MTDHKEHEELIWKYLDGLCEPEENLMVEEYLRESETFKSLFNECKKVHAMLSSQSPDQAPADLIDNTIRRLSPESNSHFPATPLAVFLVAFIILGLIPYFFPLQETGLDSWHRILSPLNAMTKWISMDTVILFVFPLSAIPVLLFLDQYYMHYRYQANT